MIIERCELHHHMPAKKRGIRVVHCVEQQLFREDWHQSQQKGEKHPLPDDKRAHVNLSGTARTFINYWDVRTLQL